jgi:hypothetical protein
MARTGFSAEAWPGNWSENDFVWVDCAPESPLYTNDPGCAYSGGAFFPRSYALNGAPFGVAFIIGKPTRRGIKCLDCNSRPMSLAGVPQPAETALVVNMKSIESLVLPTASVRCWAEMGDDQYPDHSFPDPTSPTGKRRKVSWFVAHSKGIQLSFADAHVNWMPLQQAYAANVFKYDCIRRGADARTWPMNQFHSDCGATSSTVCRAGAMALVAAEHI